MNDNDASCVASGETVKAASAARSKINEANLVFDACSPEGTGNIAIEQVEEVQDAPQDTIRENGSSLAELSSRETLLEPLNAEGESSRGIEQESAHILLRAHEREEPGVYICLEVLKALEGDLISS